MEIRIKIGDIESEIKSSVEKQLNAQIEKCVIDKFKSMDIDELIIKRIEYLIDRSKYVTDSVIRNLVQQKIARELSKDILEKIIK